MRVVLAFRAIESSPSPPCGLSELEQHDEADLPRAATLGSAVTEPDRGEDRFDRMGMRPGSHETARSGLNA